MNEVFKPSYIPQLQKLIGNAKGINITINDYKQTEIIRPLVWDIACRSLKSFRDLMVVCTFRKDMPQLKQAANIILVDPNWVKEMIESSTKLGIKVLLIEYIPEPNMLKLLLETAASIKSLRVIIADEVRSNLDGTKNLGNIAYSYKRFLKYYPNAVNLKTKFIDGKVNIKAKLGIREVEENVLMVPGEGYQILSWWANLFLLLVDRKIISRNGLTYYVGDHKLANSKQEATELIINAYLTNSELWEEILPNIQDIKMKQDL